MDSQADTPAVARVAADRGSLSDVELVLAAQRGDRDAYSVLADRHSAHVLRVLKRIAGDPESAQDALQEALVRGWRNIGSFEGRSSYFTWITRIAINETYRLLKRAGPENLPLDDAIGERVPGWGNQPEQLFESREFLDAVAHALAELPDNYRTAVVLRDLEGLSTAEAAAIAGVDEVAFKSRLHRGRMALRRRLDDYFAG